MCSIPGSVARVLIVASALSVSATSSSYGQARRQTQTDDYTRYELLDPSSSSFRIYYDVSATAEGSEYFFNGIRPGSEAIVHTVYDLMTGRELTWEIVEGRSAREEGFSNLRADERYIKIRLARPVPAGGETRLRIDKTYKDPKSYTVEDGEILFSRSLGIKRNSVVLPIGYELIGCNYPSQVVTEADGRIKISFMNRGLASVPYQVRARRLPDKASGLAGQDNLREQSASAPRTIASETRQGARIDYKFSERASQDREIVYFLQDPESHSFRLYHDYTETREGVDRYLNVVRSGSKADNPSARLLDTGEQLKVETLRGSDISARGIDIGPDISPETEVVVIWFDPVQPGHSARLRIEETYTDPSRYLRVGGELIWDRSFGRSRNVVVLPAGWYVTANSIPAQLSETDDGRVQLSYVNDRPGGIDVFIKAKRR